MTVLTDCMLETSFSESKPGDRYQFERLGYFCVDVKDSSPDKPAFNRIVALRASWTKKSNKK
jgi:glutaminyl-tRNA synthetase